MDSTLKIRDGFKGERSLIMPEMALQMAKDDLVLQTLYITDIGFYPHTTYHYRNRPTPIDQYVLIYCVKGSGKYFIEQKEYQINSLLKFKYMAMRP